MLAGCGSAAPPPADAARLADNPALASCTVSVHATERPGEATATAPTHAEACRRAAAQARDRGRGPLGITPRVLVVDEVPVNWLQTETDDGPPPAGTATTATCELVVQIRLGATTEGVGRGPTPTAALAAARAEACAAREQTECVDGYRLEVTHRATRMWVHDGQMTSETEVSAELFRVRTGAGRATAASRHLACRRAWRDACGGDCPSGARLEALDGVSLR